MWNKIQRIYIGANKVRPVTTETYTIAKQTSTSSTASMSEISIAKSWYKITKVVIETSWQSRGSSYWGNMNSYVVDNAWSTSGKKYFRYWIGYWGNNYARLEYNNGSSTTNTYNFTWYSRTGNNICTFVMERNWWSATINWTTTTWTYTSAEETIALAILDSATPYVSIQTTQWTNWPATITVTYEPA